MKPDYLRAAVAGTLIGIAPILPAAEYTFQPKTVAAGGVGDFHDAFIAQDGAYQGSGRGMGYIARVLGNNNRRYLVRFDGLDPIINGSEEITSATLAMQFYYPPASTNPAVPPSIDVHRITESWQNGATWSSRGGSLGSWTNGDGGSFGPVPIAKRSFPTAPAAFSTVSWDVTREVAAWAAGARTNHGFLVKWNDWKDFRREWFFGGPGQERNLSAPKLTVTTSQPAGLPFTVTGPTVNVRNHGAIGDGVANDTAAFRAAANVLQQAGGGTLFIPSGTYRVGEQTHVPGQYPYWKVQQIFSISNVTNLLIEGNGAKLKLADGMRYGSFDKDTGQPIFPTMPYTDLRSMASAGYIIQIVSSRNIMIRNLEIDGNSGSLVMGGQWGDQGWQVPGYGIDLHNNRDAWVENVHTHHHGCDGIIIAAPQLTESSGFTWHRLFKVRSEYNGRQGLSWVGGRGLEARYCQFNHTGRAGISTSPGAGLDIEAEHSVCRDGYFLGCEFINNAGAAVIADSGDGGYTRFVDCVMWGTTNYSLWCNKPGLRFEECEIYGTAVHGYASADPSLATKYIKCHFEDKEYGAAGVFRGSALIHCDKGGLSGANITYEDCSVVANQTRSFYLDGVGIKVRNCDITHKWVAPDQSFLALLRNIRIENTHFGEAFPAGTSNQYYIATGMMNIGPNVIVDGPLCRWGGIGGVSGVIPVNSPAAPRLLSAVSRKSHGGSGVKDIPLPTSGDIGIESRSGDRCMLVLSFDKEITDGFISVGRGTAALRDSPIASANTLTVELEGVANQQEISLELINILARDSSEMNRNLSFKVLVGDVNASSTVSSADLGLVRRAFGGAVTGDNIRNDVDANGVVNAVDASLVQQGLGRAVNP